MVNDKNTILDRADLAGSTWILLDQRLCLGLAGPGWKGWIWLGLAVSPLKDNHIIRTHLHYQQTNICHMFRRIKWKLGWAFNTKILQHNKVKRKWLVISSNHQSNQLWRPHDSNDSLWLASGFRNVFAACIVTQKHNNNGVKKLFIIQVLPQPPPSTSSKRSNEPTNGNNGN